MPKNGSINDPSLCVCQLWQLPVKLRYRVVWMARANCGHRSLGLQLIANSMHPKDTVRWGWREREKVEMLFVLSLSLYVYVPSVLTATKARQQSKELVVKVDLLEHTQSWHWFIYDEQSCSHSIFWCPNVIAASKSLIDRRIRPPTLLFLIIFFPPLILLPTGHSDRGIHLIIHPVHIINSLHVHVPSFSPRAERYYGSKFRQIML